ncbi:MAG: protein translocase subunit SecF [Gomphosphaeria aponina SAG 52.96 = DSM 107014]|uniref:Protein-export membrane protein SecF n=1 Tax=Gomphosphaeria aponina SAG 52.96 = DSM 107014 TaxID=1521640 RepID=A0A941GVQ0_9CHRO|nr:protein translocase subunit SecF [Gomphosphaeria aponina SAG 52.96 = DSM 107014]
MKFSVVRWERLWWSISAIAIIASIMAMSVSFVTLKAPLRPSLDFVGGTRVQLELDCSLPGNCDNKIESGEVRSVLIEQNLADSSIQVVEDYGVSIRSKKLDVDQRTQLQAALNEKIGKFDPQKIQIDTVGPSIGKELFISGILALIVSFVGIIVYLSFRFQFDYALFAILALFHDVLITAGAFAFLGLVAKVEVDSLFLVALLTITGFSVNDTVVIYDRIRETMARNPDLPINDIVDSAVNQTLSRSINTTLTTILPVLAIFLFGGETLKYFALALIIGFVSGAYSSIFIASTLLGWWRKRQEKSQMIQSEA